MNIDKDAIVVEPFPIDAKRVPNVKVIHPNDGLAPRDCLVSTVFTRDCDGVFVTTEPSLVVGEMLEIDVVENRVRRVFAKIVDVKETVKVTMITQTTRPL